MSETRITTETRGHVFLMGLSRPSKMNAFDSRMLRELAAAYTTLEDTPELRCGVVFAHGEHFTAGLDLMEVAPLLAKGDLLPSGDTVDPWGIFGRKRRKPIVCAIHGRCLTLGIELALASDIRVCATDARFAQIEIKRGIFPFGGATFRFVAQAGWGNAMRWLLTGDEFGADEALRLGLVQEVVEPGQALPRALSLAEVVAAQAPLGVRATLEHARRSQAAIEEAAAQALLPEILRLMGTSDAREGFMSFVERRKAVFTGE